LTDCVENTARDLDERGGRAGYLNYVTPGILLMTVAAAVQGTAIVVAMDMTGGIIDRFRTMPIARSAVLTGHVLASLIQSLLTMGIVLGVSVALGFRLDAGVLDWLAAVGLLTLFADAELATGTGEVRPAPAKCAPRGRRLGAYPELQRRHSDPPLSGERLHQPIPGQSDEEHDDEKH
jgi:hypothetical protein